MAPTIPKVLTFRRKYLDPSQVPPDWVEDTLPTKPLTDSKKITSLGAADETIAEITIPANETFRLTYLNVTSDDTVDKWVDLVKDVDGAPTTIDAFVVTNVKDKTLQGSLKQPIRSIEAGAGTLIKLQLIVRSALAQTYAGTLEGFNQFQEEATV